MKLSIAAAATSQSVNVLIRDSTSTTGAGLAAVAPAGGALLTGTKLYYSFSGANASAGVAVSLSVLAAVNSAWSSAGIVTLDGTNMIGWVRIDLPNAALAASKGRSVSFLLYGGTNMAPTPFEIELTGWDNQDVVRGGMTALPNTACTTNASLLTSGTGTDQLSVTTGRVDVGKALGTAVTLDSNNVLNVSTKYVGGTSQTARDLGASVLLSTGTGTGQLDFTSGVVKANATQWLGGTIPAVNVTGVPKVDMVDWLGSTPNALQSGRVDGYVGAFAAAMGWGPIRSNTAAAGAAGTITLDAAASSTNDFYRGRWIVLTGGTGVGQARVITTYTGSTQVASIAIPAGVIQ